MTPTWYDLLGVDPGATPEEIRTAWKTGIADLEPGDRRFRTLNEAAEVLLDPERRAAYDATLVPDEPEPDLAEEPVEEPVEELDVQPEPSWPLAEEAAPVPARGGAVPAWLLAGVAALVVLVLGAAAYLFSQPSDDDIAEATGQAQGAAERAVSTILAYDYRTMDEDQQAAGDLMTPEYRSEFNKLFQVLKDNQPETKTVVTVDQVVASGIVRSGEDRVQVLVFVNRLRTNAASSEPDEFRDQVVLTMVDSDGVWLVDGMNTNQLGG